MKDLNEFLFDSFGPRAMSAIVQVFTDEINAIKAECAELRKAITDSKAPAAATLSAAKDKEAVKAALLDKLSDVLRETKEGETQV